MLIMDSHWLWPHMNFSLAGCACTLWYEWCRNQTGFVLLLQWQHCSALWVAIVSTIRPPPVSFIRKAPLECLIDKNLMLHVAGSVREAGYIQNKKLEWLKEGHFPFSSQGMEAVHWPFGSGCRSLDSWYSHASCLHLSLLLHIYRRGWI